MERDDVEIDDRDPGMVTPKTARKMTDDRDRALYVISVAAELAGVHPQTLRLYERKGLLAPARTEGRARRYSIRDIERVRLIQTLTQEQGMNLAGVEMVVRLNTMIEEMEHRMQQMRTEMDRVRDQMHDALKRATRADIVPFRREAPWDTFGKGG